MIDQIQQIIEHTIAEHWLKLIWFPLVAAGAWWWRRRRDRRNWDQRRFLERVNCSLNTVRDGVLKIRTLFEISIDDLLLLNTEAKRKVLKSADDTCSVDPFLAMGSEENWLVLNACLNEISERYSAGLIAAEAGLRYKKLELVIGMTCERDAEKIRKLRIMAATKGTLESFDDEEHKPALEARHHDARIATLRCMAYLLRYTSWRKSNRLMVVELLVPRYAPTISEN